MADAAERHRQQVEAWNGPMGRQWAANEARTERALAPVMEALLRAADPRPGDRVLDIGCGCGGSTLAFARAVGPEGHVTGADVSEYVLEVARATAAANTTYVQADAAHSDFSHLGADLLVSRFGVMFFGDPDAAFANLRRALRPGGRLAFACWRPAAENPWVAVPFAAVRPLIPPSPPPHPEDPGQFAFGDAARVRRILASGGFDSVRLERHDFHMHFPAEPSAAAAAMVQGPASRMLRDQPDEVRAAAEAAVAEALKPHADPAGIRLGASIWLVTARSP
jgi:SAM-dependent methyltransferase